MLVFWPEFVASNIEFPQFSKTRGVIVATPLSIICPVLCLFEFHEKGKEEAEVHGTNQPRNCELQSHLMLHA